VPGSRAEYGQAAGSHTLHAMPYRLIYIGLGSLAIAVIALGIVFGRGGDPVELPGPIENVSPLPNDATLRQAVIEVDMEVGYEVAIFVDGFRVPDTEVVFIEGTGVYRWAPSPTGLYLTEWTPGTHTVRIEWSSISGLPDVGSFEWEFRVQ
jgi:hypothetical protein